jgi:hypothetical protein
MHLLPPPSVVAFSVHIVAYMQYTINEMFGLQLVVFACVWALVIYVSNCLIARTWKKVVLTPAIAYFVTIASIGLYGEIFLDTVYNYVFGRPLWYYNILPIKGGYTSSFAIVTWGLFGFHLYLLHDTLASRWSITRAKHLAYILSIEALVLEAILTLSAKLVFGKFLYYYTPSDLWHVTSFQNIPFYFIFAIIAVKTLRRVHKDPVFFIGISSFLLIVLLWLT